ncbi:hypothetical protein CQA78_31005, partial [Klebsiella pneumoniae]
FLPRSDFALVSHRMLNPTIWAGNYHRAWMEEHAWAHEACFLPRSDFALVSHRMLNPTIWAGNYHRAWMEEHA